MSRGRVSDETVAAVAASVDLAGIGPGKKPGHDVELLEKAADDLVGVGLGAEAIDLRHDAGERPLDVADGAFRVVLALLIETALTLDEFFAIERRE